MSALRAAAVAALCCAAVSCAGGDGGGDDARALFDGKTVTRIDLQLEPSAMTELAREPRDWVHGAMRIGAADARLHEEIGVRFKGHRSLRSWADKPAFRLDFERYEKDRRIRGLRGLVLNNMVDDPTMVRENLGARVFAALGVPAPRAGYAEVFVNGERFGLYAAIEPIDELFLARHFDDASGPVYEGEYGCDLYEEDVSAFKHDSGEDDRRDHLRAFARAAARRPASWLLGKKPVVDRSFLAYLAGSALVGDFDGYRHAHNYRIYRDPSRGAWSFIPWGLDRILKQRMSVFDSNGRLARACFADRACRLEYVKAVHDAARRFAALGLMKTLDRLNAAIAAAVNRDRRRPYSRDKRAAAIATLRTFISERPAEVRAQVACWDGARELDRDGDGAACMDCDDADRAVHPGAAETCDGKDNDCSGLVDDAPSCECPAAAAAGSILKATWWVGLDDREREGAFRWQDGTRPARALWGKGEPDDYACGQHCVAMTENGRGKLRDMHCATLAPFICGPVADPKD